MVQISNMAQRLIKHKEFKEQLKHIKVDPLAGVLKEVEFGSAEKPASGESTYLVRREKIGGK